MTPAVTGSSGAPRAKFVALDGLRGFAAIFVVALHVCNMLAVWRPSSAYLAVDLFFMLSGFVVPYAYEPKLRQGLGIWRFVEIRAIRLYPLYLLGVGIGLALYGTQAISAGDLEPLHATALWIPWALFMLPIPAWQPGKSFPLNPPAWSLFLEMVVNIAYALVLPWLSTRVVVAIATMAGVVLAIADQRFGTGDFGTGGVQMIWGLARVTCPFAIGVLLYRLWKDHRLPPASVPVLLPCVLFALLLSLPGDGSVGAGLAPVLVVAGLTAIVTLGIRSRPEGRIARVFEAIGLLSYPLYALHLPVLNLCRGLLPMLGLNEGAATLAGVPVVFLVAAASIRLYDEPMRARLARWAALRRAQVERAPAL